MYLQCNLLNKISDVTGGGEMFWAACYGYITDITSEKNRTKRLAYVDGLMGISFFTGMKLGAIIEKNFGKMYNFGSAMFVRLVRIVGLIPNLCLKKSFCNHYQSKLTDPQTCQIE